LPPVIITASTGGFSKNFGRRGGGLPTSPTDRSEIAEHVARITSNQPIVQQSPFKSCLRDDPLLRYVAPFSATSLINLKLPSEWRAGASIWTSIDRRLPSWMKPSMTEGAQTVRGSLGRVKWIGRYGTISAAMTAFATSYTVTSLARCYDETH
jgi:hypothetical protein